MTDVVYKIMSAALWAQADRETCVPWAPVDVTDGFVHLSSASQLRTTARLHFAGHRGLVLLDIDPSLIPPGTLRWEPSRGGQLFPHVYGDIPLAAVTRVEPLEIADGVFVFPDDIPSG